MRLSLRKIRFSAFQAKHRGRSVNLIQGESGCGSESSARPQTAGGDLPGSHSRTFNREPPMRRWGDGVKIVPFELERWQSTWEKTVDFTLPESGVEPIPLRERRHNETTTQRFQDHPLAHSQRTATTELRSKTAA